MHALVVVLFGLVVVDAPALAQPASASEQFEAANDAYGQGRYEEAVEAYRGILESGSASAALYHNLGNAYVRLDRTGPAVWAYERGRRLRPDDPRLAHNLELVRRRAGLPRTGPPPRGLPALVMGWPPLLLFGLGVLALCGAALGVVMREGSGRALAWPSPGGWGALGGGLLLVAVALGTSYVQAQARRAVVMTEEVSLRTAPADSAPADTTLRGGTVLDLRTRRDDWARVRLGTGHEGWVPTREIEDV